jgi:hypothetical protein
LAKLFFLPTDPVRDANGISAPGARLTFYAAGTSTLAEIYADDARTVPHPNPLPCDASGRYPAIYLQDISYRVVITDRHGAPLGDEIDPYVPGSFPKGDPGGNVMAIGLFTAAGGLSIPLGTDLVQTSGYSTKGAGVARYVADAAVDAAYVAAHPRWSFMSANGRGFRIAESRVTPHMLGGVESVITGNRLTGSPAYNETVTDATADVQAVFDYVKHRTDVDITGDFSGFWGLRDTDADGYCIIIDQPYFHPRKFIMGHFAVMTGETATAVFKVQTAAYNHTVTGRWEIWGQPNIVADIYTSRTVKHAIEGRALSLWDIQSIYARGFKRWGVYCPQSPSDPTYNQNIGCSIQRLKATYCGSIPQISANGLTLTYSGGVRTGSANSDLQLSTITLSGTGTAASFEQHDYVIIGGEPYEVLSVDTVNNKISIFPWLPTGQEVSGSLIGLFGGALHLRGGDTANFRVGLLDAIRVGFGVWSAGLYGCSITDLLTQGSGCSLGLGDTGGNTLGNTVSHMHSEGAAFDIIARNEAGTNTFICGVSSIGGDDFANPFKNCRVIAANNGTALYTAQALPSISINLGGVDYHSANGTTKARGYAPALSNDARNNHIRLIADTYSGTIKYVEPVDRFFRFHFIAVLEIVGTAGGAPSGAISIALDSADATAGITINGGAGPYTVGAGTATGRVHLEFWLDTNGTAKNWVVVKKAGVP